MGVVSSDKKVGSLCVATLESAQVNRVGELDMLVIGRENASNLLNAKCGGLVDRVHHVQYNLARNKVIECVQRIKGKLERDLGQAALASRELVNLLGNTGYADVCLDKVGRNLIG